MKKCLKVGAFLAALLLICFLLYAVDFFTGYPVSYFRIQHIAEQYMKENYSGMDYVLSKPSYSLKSGGFEIEASVPNTVDNRFSVSFYRDGTLKYDNYEQDVLNKMNTAVRLSNDYNAAVRNVFENSDFPFAADVSGSFQPAITGEEGQWHEPCISPEKWNTQELVLDGEYDISELSGQYGTLYLTVTSRDVSAKAAAESLLRIKAIMEQNNLPFRSVELWILSEASDDSDNPVEQLHIQNFGWDSIYKEGLEERIKNSTSEAYDAR